MEQKKTTLFYQSNPSFKERASELIYVLLTGETDDAAEIADLLGSTKDEIVSLALEINSLLRKPFISIIEWFGKRGHCSVSLYIR